MVKSIVREHNWAPNIIEDLYLDNIDFKGLIFWYNDVQEMVKQLESKNK